MKLLFDIETNGLDFSDGNFIDRVHTCYCLVIMDVETNKVSRYYDTDGLKGALLSVGKWMHTVNSTEFYIPGTKIVLPHFRIRITDERAYDLVVLRFEDLTRLLEAE